jgi:hypothetical protein
MSNAHAHDGDPTINTYRNCAISSNTVMAISFPPNRKLISLYALLKKRLHCKIFIKISSAGLDLLHAYRRKDRAILIDALEGRERAHKVSEEIYVD